MTIEQPNVIDITAINEAKREVRLIISDHLPWNVDEGDHLLMLQSKINGYLDTIESGEFYQKCPSGIGNRLVVEIVAKYPLSENARKLIENCKALLATLGLELRFVDRSGLAPI